MFLHPLTLEDLLGGAMPNIWIYKYFFMVSTAVPMNPQGGAGRADKGSLAYPLHTFKYV